VNNHIHDIKKELRAYKKKFYTNKLLKGIIFFLAILFSAFLLGNLLEFLGNLPTIGRAIVFFCFLGISLYSLVFWVLYPIYQLLRLDNYLSDKEAAIQIGAFFPDIKDKLLNTLELSSIKAADNSLVSASIRQRSLELQKTDFKTAIKFKDNKKHLTKYLITPVLILLFVLIFKPIIFTQSSDRLINYDKITIEKAPFLFQWDNKVSTAFKNETFTINLNLTSLEALPDQCYILLNGKRLLMIKNEQGSFTFTINRLIKDLDITFEAAGYKSQLYRVNVFERPALKDLSIILYYPKYLHKENKKLKNIGALVVPEGTEVAWSIKSRKTEAVQFIFDSKITELAQKNHNKFTLAKTVSNSNDYEILLKNEHSNNTTPIKYHINVIKDKYPSIQFKQFSDTLLYKYLLVGGNVSDDYGITRFTIFYRNTDKETAFRKERIELIKNQKNQEFFYELKLDSLFIEQGEKIEYFLAVWDNDGVNGSKQYKTKKQVYTIPSKEQIEKQLDTQSEKTSSDMSTSSEQSLELSEKMKKLQDDLKGKKELDWQDKKEIEKLIKEHKKFDKKIEELNKQMQQEQMQNERFNKQDEELQKKIDHLDRLMNELLDDETKKLMKELEQLLEENKNINEIQKKLDDIESNDDELQKELDRTIELYKKLKFDQQLKKNIDDLEELAEKQKDIAEKTKDKANSKEELGKEQEKLNKEFDQLKKEMKELDSMNKELKTSNEMEDFKQDQDDIQHDQQESSEELKNGSRPKASDSQKGASEKMKSMAGKMKEMQQSMEMEKMEEDLDNLRQILDNLLYLSFTQEELINSFKKVKQSDPQFVYLSQKQVNLNQSSKVVEDSLYALASRVYQIEPYITKELSNMLKYMNESNEAIKARRKNFAVAKQQYAMTAMNNLALLLDDVLDQMQEQMANKKPGQQMCNKPGSGAKPNLGKMQKELNEMIKELKNGQKQGRKLSEKVAKSAAQQQRIKEGLKQLQKEGGNSKELQEQIKELERLMDQTQKDLINKNISDQLLERQQKINVKLLEAEKAAKKQDYDNKRESNTATQNQRNYPPAFDEYLNQQEKQIEMIKTIPPNLNPYYKEQVNKYFKRRS